MKREFAVAFLQDSENEEKWQKVYAIARYAAAATFVRNVYENGELELDYGEEIAVSVIDLNGRRYTYNVEFQLQPTFYAIERAEP